MSLSIAFSTLSVESFDNEARVAFDSTDDTSCNVDNNNKQNNSSLIIDFHR